MFFKIVIVALSLLEAISNTNADEVKAIPPHNAISDSVANDLNEAKELFKRNYELRHKVTIDDVQVESKPEVFKGGYFTSEIFQISFSFEDGGRRISTSALLKAPLKLGPAYEYGMQMFFYSKEKFMYEEVIPRTYENVPYEELSPSFYGCTKSDVLIMEDLRKAGYEVFPKGSLVGLAECEAVWRSLAQFHALSTRPLDELSARIDSLTVMDYCQNGWLSYVFLPIAEKFKKHVPPQFSQGVNTFFDAFLVDFCPRWMNPAFSPNQVGRNVILHGDAHLFNILFNYNDGGIKCKFVDFQMSRRGSAVIDLMYFTIISVRSHIFGENRDALFKLYIQEFNSTLEKIGIARENFYTLDAFRTEWEKYREFYLFVLIGIAAPLWTGNPTNTGIEDFIQSADFTSTFKTWIKHLIPAEYH